MAGNPVGRLIDAAEEANGWSDRDLAARASRAGHQLSKSAVSAFRRNGMPTIVPDTIRALAAALSLPVSEVLRAALDAAGLPAGAQPSTVEHAIRSDPDLPSEIKDALLAVVRSARDNTRTGDAGRTTGT